MKQKILIWTGGISFITCIVFLGMEILCYNNELHIPGKIGILLFLFLFIIMAIYAIIEGLKDIDKSKNDAACQN